MSTPLGGRERAFTLRATGIAFALALAAEGASAQTIWTNPGTGDWFTTSNWSDGVPQGDTSKQSARAVIDNSGFALLSDPGAETFDLTLGYVSPTYVGSGYLNVSGPGFLTILDKLDINFGTLKVFGGGTVTLPDKFMHPGRIAVNGNAAVLVVKDAGSSIASTYLDASNAGSFSLSNGARANTFADVSATSSSKLNVSGSNSLWSIGGALSLTDGSTSLAVADQGVVNSYFTSIYRGASANVTGLGSSLHVTGSIGNALLIGGGAGNGGGLLNVVGGGVVTSMTAVLSGDGFGANAVPNAVVALAGVNSIWVNSGNLSVGGDSTPGNITPSNVGTGAVTVSSGAVLVAGTTNLGNRAGSYGTVSVDGAGSRWTNNGDITVGNQAIGIVNTTNGAQLVSVAGQIGYQAGSNGAVFVTGAGSSWQASGSLFIGNAGIGQLNVTDGAVVGTAGNSYLGFALGSQGSATVSGAGAVWNTTAPGTTLNIGGSQVGAGGIGQLSVLAGGTVNTKATNLYATSSIFMADNALFTGHITSSGGLIATQGITALGSAITLGEGGLSVRTGNTPATVSTFSGNIDGSGGLHKSSFLGSGVGTLVLTGANTYTGATVVDTGTLVINGTGTSAVAVNAGRLGGTGSVFAAVQVGDGAGTADATIAPGQGAGTLSTGDLSFKSDGVYAFEIDSASGVADKIAATGSVTIAAGASFNFSDLGSGPLKPGSSFIAIDNDGAEAISGQFANLAQGSVFSIGRNIYEADYFGGTGNDLVLSTAVPEPSSLAMLSAGGLGLIALSRRRRRRT